MRVMTRKIIFMLIDCTHQTPVNLDPFQFLDHVHRKPKSIAKMHVTERNMINQHIMETFSQHASDARWCIGYDHRSSGCVG